MVARNFFDRSGVPDGRPKLLLSMIPDYPLLNFMLTTSISVAVSYRLFELTNTLKTAFVPSKDDKQLTYNILAAVVISSMLYTFFYIPKDPSDDGATIRKVCHKRDELPQYSYLNS